MIDVDAIMNSPVRPRPWPFKADIEAPERVEELEELTFEEIHALFPDCNLSGMGLGYVLGMGMFHNLLWAMGCNCKSYFWDDDILSWREGGRD